MDLREVIWAQKYRPEKIADIILPKGVKNILEGILEAGEVPNMTFASASPGTGKTTTAIALCKELKHDYLVVNGSSSEERGIGMVSNIIQPFAVSMSLSGNRKVVIIDEADQLTSDAQKALRHVIEDVSRNCSFILTCNYPNRIEDAILSRCTLIEFKIPKEEEASIKKEMAKRVLGILKAEGYEISLDILRDVINTTFPDFRNIINKIQYIVEGRGEASSFVGNDDISPLVEKIRAGDYDGCIDWIAANAVDPLAVILSLSKYKGWEPFEYVVAVLVLNEAQDKHTRVPDTWLNLYATVFELIQRIKG